MCNVIDLWNSCLDIIRANVSNEVYTSWFRPIIPLRYSDNEFVLQVPTMFYYEFIDEHYSRLLRDTINKVLSKEVKLLYSVLNDGEKDMSSDKLSELTVSVVAKTNNNLPIKRDKVFSPFDSSIEIKFDSQLNEKYRFDNFIEGYSNKLARSTGLNIADNPGKTVFNPMFIYGSSGVGKTHLINAIGMEVKRQYPEKRVLYVSANLFMIQYTDSVRTNNQNDFINFYQSLDVLLIDDIHEFMTKTGTQNIFFNIFNHLQRLGKQIILTCDRPLSALKNMEDRLLSRFGWGLNVEIDRPDLELRKNILRYKIGNNGLSVPDEVVDFIADNITENIRDLEGILISLIAHSTVNKEPISMELAKRLINITPKENKKIDIDYICDLVCKHYSLSQDVLCSKSRKSEVAQPRQIAMYLARKHTSYSLNTIASTIGNRTHATVIHSCKLIDDLLKCDKHLQKDIRILEEKRK